MTSVARRGCIRRSAARQSSLELDFAALLQVADFRVVATQATSKEAHLNSPQAGALLDDVSCAALHPSAHRVQIVVTDGLSAAAVHANVPALLEVLGDALRVRGVSAGQPIVARYGRVKLAEAIATATGAELGGDVARRAAGRRCPGGPESIGLPRRPVAPSRRPTSAR